MSATSMLASFNFMNLFLRSPAIYQAELYIGFAIFCGFVVFDTQLIIEKRKSGDTDFVWHALDLFIDFIEIFRHLLIILNSKRVSISSMSQLELANCVYFILNSLYRSRC
ncbi:unnamed protein product [Dicrocoelium dendriticum]|nr:unnamed protein product [Dicrocoelium dendriticum]